MNSKDDSNWARREVRKLVARLRALIAAGVRL